MIPLVVTSAIALRLKLAQEDASAIQAGEVSGNDMTPSIFIQTGLDLKDQQ